MGAKRAIQLPVSAPFHCSLMQPAADAMADALSYEVLNAPAVPLYANVTAQPTSDPDTIRNQLVEQVTGMVRWRESIANMFAAGVEEFVELGGKVLGPMVKRIAPDATVTYKKEGRTLAVATVFRDQVSLEAEVRMEATTLARSR